MSYQQAIEAAGAKVIAFEQFGSYQGEWWALVEYEGSTGWVSGGYGSCSGCDAFGSEFGFSGLPDAAEVGDEVWDGNEYRPATQEDVDAYKKRLSDFGRDYLGTLKTQAEAEASASEDIEWDSEATEMLAWIVRNAP